MSVEKIANRQLFCILFMVYTTSTISFVPVLTTADALQDAWASTIVSFFGGAVMVLMIGGLGIRFPDMTVVQYAQKLLGTWPGKLLSLLFLWGFLHVAAINMRLYGEMLITGFLTETPLPFIMSGMVIVSALAAYNGIETIGRAADLLLPLFLLLIIGSILVPIPQMTGFMRNLEPVLARGAAPVLGGSIVAIALAVQFLMLTVLIPVTVQPRKALGNAMWALASSVAVMIPIVITITVILGPHKAARTAYPFFAMFRAIQLSEFVERVEVLAIFAWGFGLFIGVAAFIFCGARGFSQVLGLKSYRPLIFPMAVIWVALSVHSFEDVFQLREFSMPHISGPYGIGVVILPFAILWIAYIIRRLTGGGSGAN